MTWTRRPLINAARLDKFQGRTASYFVRWYGQAKGAICIKRCFCVVFREHMGIERWLGKQWGRTNVNRPGDRLGLGMQANRKQ